jgi:TonB-linked SusC/RagA family outer membrane protein
MRKITLLLLVLAVSVLAFAQRTVTGTVRDEKGEPIPFATVTEIGKNNVVKADANGAFSIRVADGARLEITASGHQTQTVTASGNTVTATLTTTNQQLTEVVVTTALGQQRQAKELGYSTAKVRAQELTQSKPVNLQNGLTGKVSGLTIQTVNNGVFADTRINLRGIRSLTGNNNPMLILDGVPVALGFINSINPQDVADVTVLKGASATAIYGPDGVNGAIVITTKRGNRNRPTITFSNTTQLEQVSFMPKFQTRFGSGSSVDLYGFGVYDPIENQGYGPEFDGTPRQIGHEFDRNGDGDTDDEGEKLFVTYEARPDEKKKFFDLGVTNQTDVSFSTGDFYLSAQNVSIKGVLPKDENNRRSFRMNSIKEYGRFKANFGVTYTRSDYNVNAGSSFGNGRDYTPYWNLINTPMQIPITQFKNWRTDFWSNPNHFYNDYYHNPYWMIDMYRSQGRTDDLLGNIELNFKATSWLNFTYRLGATFSNGTNKSTGMPFTFSQAAQDAHKSNAASNFAAEVYDENASSSRYNSEIFATASKRFENFRIEGLIGQSFRETTTKSVNVGTNNLGIPEVFNVALRKGEPNASEANSKTRLQRFFGRAAFTFREWASLELTGSYDYDSRLANPYNYQVADVNFFYPGANVAFVLSEAIPSLKASNTVSFLKVRGALSKTGNVNLGAYSLENTFGPGGGFPYGSILGFTASDVLRRDTYSPEFVISKEVGLEVGFLRNRINFEATAYSQENTDQIITVAYSAASGYTNALLNAASFTNKGIELDLRLTPLVRLGNFNIDFKVNYTYQQNKVDKLIEGVDELGIGNGNYVIVGKPAYTFKLTDYTRDSLGRVIVDRNTGFPTVDPTVKEFGQTLPQHLLGLSLNVNWKNTITFSAVADYRGGNLIYAGIGPDMDFSGISYRTGQNGRQPFIFPNSSYLDGSGKYVANNDVYTPGGYSFWSQAVNTSANSNYLADGSFWKLREVALSYNLPMRWFNFSRGAVKGASLTITGRNLITLLPKTNEWTDPEFSNTTGNAQGVSDRNNLPPTRIYGANLTVNF